MRLTNWLERTNPEKFKDRPSESPGRPFGSLALMLKVYANEINQQDNDKILIVDSVNKAFESLKIIFTRRIETSLSEGASHERANEAIYSCGESKSWYPSFISRYLQDCQRGSEGSLCTSMRRITASEPRMFVACRRGEKRVEHSQQDLVDIANVLIKLKKYLKQQCQRQRLIAATSSCDKAVQCGEYLRVSPELSFFSRSSLLVSDDAKPPPLPRGNSSPSLEYLANYRPEFRGCKPLDRVLRSFSSSAIFGGLRHRAKNSKCPRANRLQRRGAIKRTDEQMQRYCNLIEADLSPFHRNPKFGASESERLDQSDVLAVRKILLDDYISEVKDIIRSELSGSEPSHESRILDSVRKRMDDDVILSERSDSSHSLSPSAQSYVTARECPSSCCCCCCCSQDSGTCLRFKRQARSCSLSSLSNRGETRRGSLATDYSRISSEEPSAKSSQSMDSGVQLEDALPRGWSSAEEAKKESEDSCSSDEMLCRRVESAVRKFTDKLIVCERRARDRSSSPTKRQPRHKLRGCTSLTDRSTYEDERLAGISTPSLVSLSDEDIRA